MNRFLIATFLALSVFAGSAAAQPSSEPLLTNASVIKLVKAGFKEKTVITIISNRPNIFDLEPEQLIDLKRQGVSENIILAMLATQDATLIVNEDEQWASDEQFFRGLKRSNSGGSDKQSGSTGIFGSGGSSQSKTESRGGSGGNQNEGNVTGSATVRIMKPSTEAGGAVTPKLEKTPTLNNEGVIKLVDAGFSEGTIIKRIEESPVEFDLSPAKVEELHKRRVTDAIITAMSAAMGVEPKP
ncbi:MAG TPA: hypothetical protein VFY34_03990 [Pyrinomonadaceae bacterium]|nr:hypothetical protein [Pyrinomonadaceae bacterium]